MSTTVQFKLNSSNSASSFVRFSLTADSPAELLIALVEKLTAQARDVSHLGYIDSDGDTCELVTEEDLAGAIDHFGEAAIVLNAPPVKKAGDRAARTRSHTRSHSRGRRDRSSSSSSSTSSSSSSSSSSSDDDGIIDDLAKRNKKVAKKAKKLLKKCEKKRHIHRRHRGPFGRHHFAHLGPVAPGGPRRSFFDRFGADSFPGMGRRVGDGLGFGCGGRGGFGCGGRGGFGGRGGGGFGGMGRGAFGAGFGRGAFGGRGGFGGFGRGGMGGRPPYPHDMMHFFPPPFPHHRHRHFGHHRRALSEGPEQYSF